jgi:hypothetical protein
MKTVVVAAALLASSVAWANGKLLRPVSTQNARAYALSAVKASAWQGKHRVTQVGVMKDGTVVHMVMAEGQKVPKLVATKMEKQSYSYGDGKSYSYVAPKSRVLSSKQIRELGLLDPKQAMGVAAHNGGQFGKVKGKLEFAGGTRWSGQAYKINVTPEQPVTVKVPYGTWTIDKLERIVNVAGRGESARPIGNSKFKYQPR